MSFRKNVVYCKFESDILMMDERNTLNFSFVAASVAERLRNFGTLLKELMLLEESFIKTGSVEVIDYFSNCVGISMKDKKTAGDVLICFGAMERLNFIELAGWGGV